MNAGRLTEREKEVLDELLKQRGISYYQLFELSNEGKSLPGSTYPDEIESMSGWVITPQKVFMFWLNWVGGHYTLGEERGFWKEVSIEDLGRDKDRVMQIQQELKKAK